MVSGNYVNLDIVNNYFLTIYAISLEIRKFYKIIITRNHLHNRLNKLNNVINE